MAALNFNARTVAPATGRADPIPAGWYDGKIIKSEIKPTKDASGLRLNLEFEIIGGQFNARKVFQGLNIRNSNPTAQEIAMAELSAIAHAVNVLDVQDSAQLHNIPMKIRVKVVPGDGQYEARNEITTYANINTQVNAPVAAQTGGQPYQAVPQAPAGFGAHTHQQPVQHQQVTQPVQQAAPQQPVHHEQAPNAGMAQQPWATGQQVAETVPYTQQQATETVNAGAVAPWAM